MTRYYDDQNLRQSAGVLPKMFNNRNQDFILMKIEDNRRYGEELAGFEIVDTLIISLNLSKILEKKGVC